MPVTISPKFWAEHMGLPYMQGAIRPQEMLPRNNRDTGFFSRSSGSRSFLRYGYGDLYAEDRRYKILHRIWPGTQRLLLWGDPEIAADYGRVSSFCGSNGVEIFEPLFFKGRKGSGLPGGRDAYADAALKPARDFEKYDYTYRVWGRNLYNPDGEPDGWRRASARQFGRGAEPAERALASASRILPLVITAHCPSAANNNYWPEMYCNMPIVNADRRNPYSDTPSPKVLGTVSPLDPEFFLGVDEFAGELLDGKPSGKYSPAWVATQLEQDAESALAELQKAKSKMRDANSPEFRRLAVDVAIQAGLGKFFAAKFRAGTLFAIYQRAQYTPALEAALKANRAARAAWAELAATANGIYRNDVTFGPEYFQHGHWQDRLAAMDDDIADMEAMLARPTDQQRQRVEGRSETGGTSHAQALPKPERDKSRRSQDFTHRRRHSGAASRWPSRRTRPHVWPACNCAIAASIKRRMRWWKWGASATERHARRRVLRAEIPAAYTDSPFPLQYHFQIHAGDGVAQLHPGLKPGWNGQPYFVVRQA